MKRPPPWRRQDEAGRQRAFDRLGLVRGRTDERLDTILEMVRRFFATESVSLNMLDQDQQVAIVCTGAVDRVTPRGTSFCDRLLDEEGLSIVPDAALHPLFSSHPNVVGTPFVRFYAGYPIHSPDGYRVGMLCIFDSTPRDLDELEREALRNFALMTQDVLWSADPPQPAHSADTALGRLVDADSSAGGRVENALTGALDHMRTGVYLFDHDWRLFFVNQFGRSLFPDPSAVRLGDTLWTIDPATMENEFGSAFRAAVDEDVVTSIRAYQPRLGGWYESTTYPIAEGVAIYFRDVTAEQDTRTLLDDTILDLQRKAALLDATLDAVVVIELDGTITYWNPGAESIYGWTAAEAEGASIWELVTSDRGASLQAWKTMLAEGSWSGELGQTTRDGTTIVMDGRWQLEREASGEPAFVLCIATDATERRREQESRYRAQRMESLGTLAGGMAHDLNNVFTPILMSAQILATEESPDARDRLTDAIEVSVRRGADMIRQVLGFARGQDDQPSAVIDIRAVLGELLAFCQAILPKTIEMDLDVPDDLWSISGDSTQVLQILMNLVTNARDAMPHGGTLHVRAWNTTSGGVAPGAGGPAEIVVVTVEDTGEGMDPVTLSKVFEPFFSTKTPGSGTGLGLSTSASIARSHGGDLRAYSERNRGSAFVLELPRAAPGPSEPVSHEQVAPITSEGGVVLVVDDEPLIRSIVEETLGRHGYETRQAENGLEAIEMIGHGHPVDLVFTDLMMPVMGGAELIAWLEENRPDVALVVMSGLDANQPAVRGCPGRSPQFLVKPFTGADAVGAVHRALGRASREADDLS